MERLYNICIREVIERELVGTSLNEYEFSLVITFSFIASAPLIY